MKEVDKATTLVVLGTTGGLTALAGTTLLKAGDIQNGSISIPIGGVAAGWALSRFIGVIEQ